jgi:predicted HTH domain antitoxin
VLLAIKLWEIGRLSLGQAAAVAGYSRRTFMEILGKQGVPIFDYNPEELVVEQGI